MLLQICIHYIHVDYAEGTTPRTREVELRQERQSRAIQERLPRNLYTLTRGKVSLAGRNDRNIVCNYTFNSDIAKIKGAEIVLMGCSMLLKTQANQLFPDA